MNELHIISLLKVQEKEVHLLSLVQAGVELVVEEVNVVRDVAVANEGHLLWEEEAR